MSKNSDKVKEKIDNKLSQWLQHHFSEDFLFNKVDAPIVPKQVTLWDEKESHLGKLSFEKPFFVYNIQNVNFSRIIFNIWIKELRVMALYKKKHFDEEKIFGLSDYFDLHPKIKDHFNIPLKKHEVYEL